MKPVLVWVLALCSIPVILFAVLPQGGTDCTGSASCIRGKITRIIDGDTLDVDDKRIRLALAFAPELDQAGGIAAREFVEQLCPVGSDALADEDDGQVGANRKRIIAAVYCRGMNLNEEVLENGHGYIPAQFCPKSEFGSDDWAVRHGC